MPNVVKKMHNSKKNIIVEVIVGTGYQAFITYCLKA